MLTLYNYITYVINNMNFQLSLFFCMRCQNITLLTTEINNLIRT